MTTYPPVGWRFWALDRDEDVSRVSGTGRKAYVIEALDYPGCLLVWDTSWVTVDWRPSMEIVEAIHGHDGRTRFTPLDDDPEARERALTLWRQVERRAIATFEAARGALS